MTKEFKRCLVIDGKAFVSIEEAQKYELEQLLSDGAPTGEPDRMTALADFLLTNSERLLDILTTNEKSRPKARRINGGVKKRKAAAVNAVTV